MCEFRRVEFPRKIGQRIRRYNDQDLEVNTYYFDDSCRHYAIQVGLCKLCNITQHWTVLCTHSIPWMTAKRNVSQAMKRQVAAEQQWLCALCSVLLDVAYQVDHRLPLWKNGPNCRWNLQALCPTCHARKTYLESIGPIEESPPNVRLCIACTCIYSPYFTHVCTK
jgi:5-methylcytosine-specific restriction endonuclease McrA